MSTWCDKNGTLSLWYFFPNPRPQSDHEAIIRGILQNTWSVPLNTLKVIKNKESLRICQRRPQGDMTTNSNVLSWMGFQRGKRTIVKNLRNLNKVQIIMCQYCFISCIKVIIIALNVNNRVVEERRHSISRESCAHRETVHLETRQGQCSQTQEDRASIRIKLCDILDPYPWKASLHPSHTEPSPRKCLPWEKWHAISPHWPVSKWPV
jgi:hypothetical protein